MIRRDFWLERIEDSWTKAPLVWLTGVRRVGKTTLAQSIPDARFVNCDLPSATRELEDPERFYHSVSQPVVIFDEVHRLGDPSRTLKIGVDAFKHLKLLATGSSTLAATRKFRDSLTGRKRAVHLLPALERERAAFGVRDLKMRLLRGGLPEPLLVKERDLGFYSEWLDSFYARDVEELFRVGKREAFLRLVQLVLRNSGGVLEATTVARQCGLTRPTVARYLDVLAITHLITTVRPYHRGGRQELLKRPKVYGFDTGFVSFCRGWDELREQDCGRLWEHLVLETLTAHVEPGAILYWADKQRHEVDFVLPRGRNECDAIECKWDADEFAPRGLRAFRQSHPKGDNYVVSPQVGPAYRREVEGLEVTFCNLTQWESLQDSRRPGLI